MKKSTNRSQMADVIKLRGCLEVALFDAATGAELKRHKFNNLVVTAGRKWALSRLVAADTNPITNLEVGVGTAAPAAGDTALGSATIRKVATLDSTNITSSVPNVAFRTSYDTNEANVALCEAGLFNSSAAGTMFSRLTFATINKATSNTLGITYTVSN